VFAADAFVLTRIFAGMVIGEPRWSEVAAGPGVPAGYCAGLVGAAALLTVAAVLAATTPRDLGRQGFRSGGEGADRV
jgi:hypothetical protein